MTTLPKYAKEKMKGNIGEAFVQYVLSQFCLVHSIDGSNDIGNDFICELIKEENPTNLLFYVQVKYHKRKPEISPTLLEYWKSSPIPVFLFWVKDIPGNGSPDGPDFFERRVFYKRYTPIVHNLSKHKNEKFKPFTEAGFKRDLIVDYARSLYRMGFAPVIKPRDFLNIDEKILMGFEKYILFQDVASEYRDSILNQSWSNLFLTSNFLMEEGRLLEAKEALQLALKLFEQSDTEEKWLFRPSLESAFTDLQKLLEKENLPDL